MKTYKDLSALCMWNLIKSLLQECLNKRTFKHMGLVSRIHSHMQTNRRINCSYHRLEFIRLALKRLFHSNFVLSVSPGPHTDARHAKPCVCLFCVVLCVIVHASACLWMFIVLQVRKVNVKREKLLDLLICWKFHHDL